MLIGLGLKLEHLTQEALQAIKSCDSVFLEKYTLDVDYNLGALTKLTNKEIKLLERKDVETFSFFPSKENNNPAQKDFHSETFQNNNSAQKIPLPGANKNNISAQKTTSLKTNQNFALLVFGDPLIATTHTELILEAKQRGIETKIIHNISILDVISRTGLQPYKFGKTTSIPFWQENIEYKPLGFYNVLEQNLSIGAHTLFLLDPNQQDNKNLTPNRAIEMLREAEAMRKKGAISDETLFIVCCRICSKTEKIVVS
ncbi:MAG: diphthine synthase, partial [Euryarchaeota archaeon HGW-Euryarchaeota-1]